MKEEKVEPPEMAVFSFIDLPDVLTHEKKGVHIMKNDKQLKEAYQFHKASSKKIEIERKKQKWILINKQGKLSGILDHSDYDTRKSAKEWFQRTSDLSGGTINIDDYYYVLKVEEYEFLKELDILGLIDNQDIN